MFDRYYVAYRRKKRSDIFWTKVLVLAQGITLMANMSAGSSLDNSLFPERVKFGEEDADYGGYDDKQADSDVSMEIPPEIEAIEKEFSPEGEPRPLRAKISDEFKDDNNRPSFVVEENPVIFVNVTVETGSFRGSGGVDIEHVVTPEQKVDNSMCGYPVCTIIDTKIRTFDSMCALAKFMNENEFDFKNRILQVQRGSCELIIKNLDPEMTPLQPYWTDKRPSDCKECNKTDGCNIEVSIAYNRAARTFTNVCKLMRHLAYLEILETKSEWRRQDMINLNLGPVEKVYDETACMMTEWFDLDQPCNDEMEQFETHYNYILSIHRTSEPTYTREKEEKKVVERVQLQKARICDDEDFGASPEFKTANPTSLMNLIFKADKTGVVCKNEENPHYNASASAKWNNADVTCPDFKARYCCKAQFGKATKYDDAQAIDPIYKNVMNIEDDYVGNLYVFGRNQLPYGKIGLFDSCKWNQFNDVYSAKDGNEYETRNDHLQANPDQAGKVCEAKGVKTLTLINALYFDVRDKNGNAIISGKDGIILKESASFGVICEKNSFKKDCPDLKVRYCCINKEAPTWNQWSEWTKCGDDCKQCSNRTRTCPPDGNGECMGANNIDMSLQTRPCECKSKVEWTQWSQWSKCSTTCGKGAKYRNRNCTHDFGDGTACDDVNVGYQGRMKVEIGKFVNLEVIPCVENEYCCDAFTAAWSEWSRWTDCTGECGKKYRTTTRCCKYNGPGSNETYNQLNNSLSNHPTCPVESCVGNIVENYQNGMDNLWKTGIKKNGSVVDTASKLDIRKCNLKQCPVKGSWTQWTKWSECPKEYCSINYSQRTRYCGDPPPSNASDSKLRCKSEDKEKLRNATVSLNFKEVEGIQIQERKCLHYPEKCPVPCKVSQWSAWTSCMPECYSLPTPQDNNKLSQTIALPRKTRIRRIEQEPKNKGTPCPPILNASVECDPCPNNVKPSETFSCAPVCDRDCVWTEWTEWTNECKKCRRAMSKDLGSKSRERTVQHLPLGKGRKCTAKTDKNYIYEREGAVDLEEIQCTKDMVPECGIPGDTRDDVQLGLLDPWEEWGACNATCDNDDGWRTRTRKCSKKLCAGAKLESVECHNPCEKLLDGWSSWSAWTDCDANCGNQDMMRNRMCQEIDQECEGENRQSKACPPKPECPSKLCPYCKHMADTMAANEKKKKSESAKSERVEQMKKEFKRAAPIEVLQSLEAAMMI